MVNLVAVLVAVGTTLFALSVMVVAARVWSRVHISRNFGIEDFLMIISLILFAAFTGITYGSLQYGLGRHGYEIPLEQYTPHILKLTVAFGAIFVASLGIVKISVLIFYHKTFPLKAMQATTLVFIVITAGYTLAFTVILIFPCSPVARAWNPSITSGYCVDRFAVYYTHGGFNLIIDLAIIILPLPPISGLRIPTKEKAIILVLVTLYVAAVGIGSARFWATQTLQKGGDLTWQTGLGVTFGGVEVGVSIICGSIIVMRPFFRRYIPSFITSSLHSEPAHLISPSRLSFD